MPLSSSNLRPQRQYKLELPFWSIVIILLTAFASSFFLGWNVSLLLSDNFQPEVQDPLNPRIPTWKPLELEGSSRMRVKEPDLISRNAIHNEMFVHPVLFSHPDPKQVAIVSSNPNALIDQVRMHTSVKSIWVPQDDSDTCTNENEKKNEKFRESPSNNDEPIVIESPQIEWIHTHALFEAGNSAMLDVVFLDESRMQEMKPPVYWYSLMSSDGILIMQVGVEGTRYLSKIDELIDAKFEFIIDYKVHHYGKQAPSLYIVAFKSSITRARWHLKEAHFNVEIHRRIRHTSTNSYFPFEYFDSAAMTPIEFPSKSSEVAYCKHRPTSKECQKGHGLDPEILDFPVELLKAQKSSMGESAGKGVFTTVNIPAGSYIGSESLSNVVRGQWRTFQMMESLNVHNAIYHEFEAGEITHFYFDGQGLLSEIWGEPESTVRSGILTFTNHGCNGTYNIGLKSEFHELNVDFNNIPKEYVDHSEPYNPARERNRLVVILTSLTDLKAGDELADNYMPYGGEKYFEFNALDLRTDCSRGFGVLWEYERQHAIDLKVSQFEGLLGQPPKFLQLQNLHERPAVSAHHNFHPLAQWEESRLYFDFDIDK